VVFYLCARIKALKVRFDSIETPAKVPKASKASMAKIHEVALGRDRSPMPTPR
jgi:hypothetical protein